MDDFDVRLRKELAEAREAARVHCLVSKPRDWGYVNLGIFVALEIGGAIRELAAAIRERE